MFKDFKLKLSVLSVLMEDGHYVKEAQKLKKKHGPRSKDHTPTPEVIAYYESIEIPDALLATVTSLSPDGGDLAYVHAMNVWDGEDDQFNITSLKGIDKLVNLEEFSPIAMIDEDGIDYTPLLACKKLKRVDMSFGKGGKKDEKVAAELRSRGVEVEE